jgi:hypothetical protein
VGFNKKTEIGGGFNYKVVSNINRKRVRTNPRTPDKYNRQDNDPLILDLLEGKTVVVDVEMSYGRGKFNKAKFRYLYPFFSRRGMVFRIHLYDDHGDMKYRRLIMWAEKE